MICFNRQNGDGELRRVKRAGAVLAGVAGAAVLLAACTGTIGEGDTDGAGGDGGAGTGTPGGTQGAGTGSATSGSGTGTAASSGAGGNGAGGAGGAGGTESGSSSSSSSSSSSASSSSSGSGGASPTDALCARWNGDRANLGEGTWSGSVNGCNAGDISADGRANALKLVNLYRFIAGLPEVSTAADRDQKAQACALMMDANNQLSHSPPMNWACYTADGAQAAGNSNISSTPGVEGVDLYMADPGNPTTIGHRRWILSGSLGPIGLGSTSSRSCMWVIGGSGAVNPAFTAWPSPGLFPIQAMNASFQSVDQTGWTIQSSSIDLGGAQVTVTDAGQSKPVKVTQLANNYGSTYAISMIPEGWTSQAGHTYAVSVAGVSQAISYEVQMVDCN
jgi:uncharacterized protein YkwD